MIIKQVVIGQYYTQLKLNKQTKFYIDNIKKEIKYLYMLVKIEWQKFAGIEQDIVFL